MKPWRFIKIGFLVGILQISAVHPALGKEFTVNLALMPIYAESKDQGLLVDFIRALERETGHKFTIKMYPFARSIRNVILGAANFHLPMIEPYNLNTSELDYDYSSETVFHVNFVLYTNANKKIDSNHLERYTIETDRAHIQYFDFKILPSTCLECSLKKLNAGRIDGFIFSDKASDPLIRKYNLTSIHRQLYRIFAVKMVIPKGSRQGEMDQILSKGIRRLKEKGEYREIMSAMEQPYRDWQPAPGLPIAH